MELGKEPQDQDIDLIRRAPEVTSQSPPPVVLETVSSEKREVVLLDDDSVMDVYNLSFDELQRKIVQAWINHFLDVHGSFSFMEERVIVSDTRKRPTVISQYISAYAGATSSNVQ